MVLSERREMLFGKERGWLKSWTGSANRVDNKIGLRIELWKIQTILKRVKRRPRRKYQSGRRLRRVLLVEGPREEAVSRMEKPTESNAEKYRKKTKKHALEILTERTSLSDIREISVKWWAGSLVSSQVKD